MTFEVATVRCAGPGPVLPGYTDQIPEVAIVAVDNRENKVSPCLAYQQILECSIKDVIIYVHDDVSIHDDDWRGRIMTEMREDVVSVGLGGATSLGNWDLYRKPYDIRNMARGGYCSNQTDAEVHGERFTGSKRVAVLDAFCMAVRTDWLRSIGGWPTDHLTHHCLDLWLACEAARASKEIWMTGVSCTHHGGGTSTKEEYAQAGWRLGGSNQEDHSRPHKWLYETFRDVLPISVHDS